MHLRDQPNDGTLNDIRGLHIHAEHVLAALQDANDGPVAEGSVGAGAGTVCFGFKGGIGSSSRLVSSRGASPPRYTVGALVQTNYGGILELAGIPAGKELQREQIQRYLNGDGSCMIIIATDAPLAHAALMRLAKRAMLAIGRTGSSSSNGSGDYVIAFSTSEKVRVPHVQTRPTQRFEAVNNDVLSLLFQAAMEATEEAICNSLLRATAVTSADGLTIDALPLGPLRTLIQRHRP